MRCTGGGRLAEQMYINVQLKDLLEEANYQMEFTNLASALISYYEEMGLGRLNIVENRENGFYSLGASNNWKSAHFEEAISLTFSNDDLNKGQPILLLNTALIEDGYIDHLIYPFHVNEKLLFLLVFSFPT